MTVQFNGYGYGFAQAPGQPDQGQASAAVTPRGCPASVSVDSQTVIPLAANMDSCPGPAGSCSNFPNYLTGMGIETIMKLSPTNVDWSGLQITEQVSISQNNCPTITPCSGTGGFEIGVRPYNYAYGQRVSDLPATNRNAYFFDWHVNPYPTDVLGPPQMSSCQAVCTQTFWCGTTQISGTFTITKNGNHTTINSTPVTQISATKSLQ